jgi:hypothetical protein
MKLLTTYELSPVDGRKSFYGKAKAELYEDGSEILLSYDTPIIYRSPDGELSRLWHGWTATTGRHIKSFSGLNKAEYEKLPFIDLTESKEITIA